MENENPQTRFSKRNLLIVDDHIHLRKTLALWITDLYPEIQILEAENGDQAIQIIQSCCVDLVLMDYKMPGIDGLEATRRIKQISPTTPVYLMSIYDREAYRREALLAGTDGFLSKNTVDADLPVILSRFIEGKEI